MHKYQAETHWLESNLAAGEFLWIPVDQAEQPAAAVRTCRVV